MTTNNEVTRLLYKEFPDIFPNLLWSNEDGSYNVFGKYTIEPKKPGYRVFCSATEVGTFSSSRSALSWCIADKNKAYKTAQELLETDRKLTWITQDIATRAAIGDKSRDPGLREIILTKLESKIILKKLLENQLTKCINWAKYVQQQGFDNETQRTGRGQPNKTSR